MIKHLANHNENAKKTSSPIKKKKSQKNKKSLLYKCSYGCPNNNLKTAKCLLRHLYNMHKNDTIPEQNNNAPTLPLPANNFDDISSLEINDADLAQMDDCFKELIKESKNLI